MSKPPQLGPTLDYCVPSDLRADAVVFWDNRTRRIVFLAIGFVFLGGGLAVVLRASPILAMTGRTAPLLIVAGVITITVSAWRLLSRKPRLIVDAAGVTDHFTGLGLIPWQQITACKLVSDGPLFLCLTVVDPQAIRAKRGLSLRDRGRFGSPAGAGPHDVTIPVSGITAKPAHVLAVIQQHWQNAAKA